METLDQMAERHRKEMGDVLVNQVHSWKALRDQHGETIPIDVHQQWEQQYGAQRRDALLAAQVAEREAHPLNPMEYRYQDDPQPEPVPAQPEQTVEQKPAMFEQLKQQQQAQEQQRIQDLNEKLMPVVDMEAAAQKRQEEEKKQDIFEQLKRQQEQQERDRRGHEYER